MEIVRNRLGPTWIRYTAAVTGLFLLLLPIWDITTHVMFNVVCLIWIYACPESESEAARSAAERTKVPIGRSLRKCFRKNVFTENALKPSSVELYFVNFQLAYGPKNDFTDVT